MNVQATIARPDPVKLQVRDFLLLNDAGAFAEFTRAELLAGELWGVPRGREEEPDFDSSFPIKLRIADYELLERSGAFEGYRKTELIDGVVYAMNPQYRPHGFVKDEMAYRLRRALEAIGSKLHVATEQSVALEPNSEPQPDIILTAEPRGPGRHSRRLGGAAGGGFRQQRSVRSRGQGTCLCGCRYPGVLDRGCERWPNSSIMVGGRARLLRATGNQARRGNERRHY